MPAHVATAESWQDQARAVALSIGIHLICFGLIGMGLWWQKHTRPLSVAGAPIEAVLWTGPLPSVAPTAAPPPARATPRPPPAKAEPAQPIQRPDTVDRERAAALTQQQSIERAQREEQERQRQRQVELSEQERQARAEAARRALEDDRRRQEELAQARAERELAERQSRVQQERLAQLSDLDRQQPAERPAPVEGPLAEPREAEPVGNFGTDTGLAARYMLAIQQTVTQNWLRPDTTRPGLQCRLRIIQIPGGEVINVQVMSPCNGDDLARRSIEAAVLRAQPLPYSGYESVFQREIDFNFRYDG